METMTGGLTPGRKGGNLFEMLKQAEEELTPEEQLQREGVKIAAGDYTPKSNNPANQSIIEKIIDGGIAVGLLFLRGRR